MFLIYSIDLSGTDYKHLFYKEGKPLLGLPEHAVRTHFLEKSIYLKIRKQINSRMRIFQWGVKNGSV